MNAYARQMVMSAARYAVSCELCSRKLRWNRKQIPSQGTVISKDPCFAFNPRFPECGNEAKMPHPLEAV